MPDQDDNVRNSGEYHSPKESKVFKMGEIEEEDRSDTKARLRKMCSYLDGQQKIKSDVATFDGELVSLATLLGTGDGHADEICRYSVLSLSKRLADLAYYMCCLCQQVFPSSAMLAKHRSGHLPWFKHDGMAEIRQKLYLCRICDSMFLDLPKAVIHVIDELVSKGYTIPTVNLDLGLCLTIVYVEQMYVKDTAYTLSKLKSVISTLENPDEEEDIFNQIVKLEKELEHEEGGETDPAGFQINVNELGDAQQPVMLNTPLSTSNNSFEMEEANPTASYPSTRKDVKPDSEKKILRRSHSKRKLVNSSERLAKGKTARKGQCKPSLADRNPPDKPPTSTGKGKQVSARDKNKRSTSDSRQIIATSRTPVTIGFSRSNNHRDINRLSEAAEDIDTPKCGSKRKITPKRKFAIEEDVEDPDDLRVIDVGDPMVYDVAAKRTPEPDSLSKEKKKCYRDPSVSLLEKSAREKQRRSDENHLFSSLKRIICQDKMMAIVVGDIKSKMAMVHIAKKEVQRLEAESIRMQELLHLEKDRNLKLRRSLNCAISDMGSEMSELEEPSVHSSIQGLAKTNTNHLIKC